MSAAKDASTSSAARASFSIRRSSRPIMASISRSPALNTVLRFACSLSSQRGSSKPQIFPAQPPASTITVIASRGKSTAAAPDVSGANGAMASLSPCISWLETIFSPKDTFDGCFSCSFPSHAEMTARQKSRTAEKPKGCISSLQGTCTAFS